MHRLSRLSAVIIIQLIVIASPHGAEHAPPKERVAPDYLAPAEATAVALYRKVLPTVVTIATSRSVVTPHGPEVMGSAGSGVLIAPDSHVLTAAHLIEGAEEILVKTHDGESRPAELVYVEPGADIALLRLTTPVEGLEHATLGDSDRLAVGQIVYVIGSPFGLENSFSVGHISGFREFDRLYDGTIAAEFIQTDAAINSGNSGGPVFNSAGDVIGIASRILTLSGGFEGLSFVVAINTAKQLLAIEDRPWIGIEAIFLNGQQLGRLFHLDLEGGMLVQRVARGSPADKAGLRGGSIPARILDRDVLLGGDLILEFNKQETCHANCLIREGMRITKLDRIPIKYLRDGKMVETMVDVSRTHRNLKTAGSK